MMPQLSAIVCKFPPISASFCKSLQVSASLRTSVPLCAAAVALGRVCGERVVWAARDSFGGGKSSYFEDTPVLQESGGTGGAKSLKRLG